MAAISPTQDDVQKAVRAFLLTVLPAGVDAIIAIENRVPEPSATSFVVMSPLRMKRLATNVDSSADVKFTGSISGTVLTVTAVAFGAIAVGATVFGVGVTTNTQVIPGGTGTGGVGTYNVSQSQTVGSETLSSGAMTLTQSTEVTVQLDFYSDAQQIIPPAASDMAQIVSTALRDEYGVDTFAAQGFGVVPLYADDPQYVAFVDENQQSEWRWMVEAVLQIHQTVAVPQQYADSTMVQLVSVDAAYPPSP